MSKYTPEEIEEMRKRLPFKAVVRNVLAEDTYTTTEVKHIFNDGKCADKDDVWMYFKEIKEPEYVPFDKETIKPFRDEWVKLPDGWIVKILSFNDKRIDTVYENKTYKEALDEWKFADSGKPFGKEVMK